MTVQSRLAALRKAALSHPGVVESVACRGTAIESASFKVKGKAFLFLRPAAVMLKLGPSMAEAAKLSDACKVGSGGWTTIPMPPSASLSSRLMERWVKESYLLFAGDSAKPGRPARTGRSRP